LIKNQARNINKEQTVAFTLSSPAFDNNGDIPAIYTCQGKDSSPPLTWQDAPASTRSLALIVDDPDAPDPQAPRMTWVHWVVYNLPPNINKLPAAADDDTLPQGSLEGINDWHHAEYGGPCPPIGRHRYFFKLYALDMVLPDMHKPTKAQLETAMRGHILDKVELVGTYKK
jgi:Raf kinase inhibitor-like YbhB/YbcL family protein